MQTTLENKKKAITNCPKNVLKKNNQVEEGRASDSRMKKEQESTKARAQKMMKGKVEPSIVPTMVWVVLTMVEVAKQITKVPQMTFPQERPLKEQRQKVPQMRSPQERQLKEQRQEVKRVHDTRFLEGEEHLHFNGDVYEDWMETT